MKRTEIQKTPSSRRAFVSQNRGKNETMYTVSGKLFFFAYLLWVTRVFLFVIVFAKK